MRYIKRPNWQSREPRFYEGTSHHDDVLVAVDMGHVVAIRLEYLSVYRDGREEREEWEVYLEMQTGASLSAGEFETEVKAREWIRENLWEGEGTDVEENRSVD